MTTISRRKVLSIVAASAGGLVAKASGLMPEIALAGEAPRSAAATTTEGNMVLEQFDSLSALLKSPDQHEKSNQRKNDDEQHEQGTPYGPAPPSTSAMASPADDAIDIAAWEQGDADELEEGEVRSRTMA